jgi:predicted ribosome quality control (RQC) complex YloA/Tae2 family protein
MGTNGEGATADEVLSGARAELLAALARAGKRVERRIAAVRGDLDRVKDADAIASQAQWLVAEAARAPRGARSLKVTDWSTGEPRPLELPLDPARPAREQVEALFKRARRIRKGAVIAHARLAQAEAMRDALLVAAEEAEAATSPAQIEALIARARAAAPRDFTLSAEPSDAARKKRKPGERVPYRTFHGAGGARILVGKRAADNDALTLHVARPQDLWLHAKGRSGAHVVVPLTKGQACPPDLLVDAAHLAAHFGGGREETLVEVTYAPKRYVRKPRRSPVGLVVVDREKVLLLRVESARTARLLASEEAEADR